MRCPGPRLAYLGLSKHYSTLGTKIVAPPMVFIKGEEMTRYCMDLIMKEWVEPHIDTSRWEFYDLSCKVRDDTEDQVCIEHSACTVLGHTRGL